MYNKQFKENLQRLELKMTTLSFDIGIKNLAYCMIDYSNDIEIIEWDIINLNPRDVKHISIKELTENVLFNLEKKFEESDIEYVVIENQPVMKNPVMKSIQMIIYTYFHHYNILYQKTIHFDVTLNLMRMIIFFSKFTYFNKRQKNLTSKFCNKITFSLKSL